MSMFTIAFRSSKMFYVLLHVIALTVTFLLQKAHA
uniref:Uncharacterized protein n=1 Tax=Anguilla anguilla TaxID=7936 RepID=A0A0E9RU48_ANGAN